MVDTKHTPGPWLRDGTTVYALNEQGTNRTCFNVANGGDIWRSWDHASYDHRPTPADEHEANARLIAAAPDLLTALGIMTGLVRLRYGNLDADVTAEIDKALAAIAKAAA